MNIQTALHFVKAINAHDVPAILALMTDDHIFIDAYGNTESREAMQQGWPSYFAWFPDYLIEIETILEDGGTVVLLGYASGTFGGAPAADTQRHWRIPAAWRVVTASGKVKAWQVYADSKIPFDSMRDSDE